MGLNHQQLLHVQAEEHELCLEGEGEEKIWGGEEWWLGEDVRNRTG